MIIFFQKNISFFFIYVFFIHLECFLRINLYLFKSRFTARVINAMASNQKTTTIKTLRKWEKEFQLKLDFDINTEYKFSVALGVLIVRNGSLELKRSKAFQANGSKGLKI